MLYRENVLRQAGELLHQLWRWETDSSNRTKTLEEE
jgi:hypothetical protein